MNLYRDILYAEKAVCTMDIMPALVKNGSLCFQKYDELRWKKRVCRQCFGLNRRKTLKAAKRLDHGLYSKYLVFRHLRRSSNNLSSLDRRKSLTVCNFSGKSCDTTTSSDTFSNSNLDSLPADDFDETSGNGNNTRLSERDCCSKDTEGGFWRENDFRKRISSFIHFVSGSHDSDVATSTSFLAESQGKGVTFKHVVSRLLRLLDGKSISPFEPRRRKLSAILHKAEEKFFQFAGRLGTYICIITGTGAILATGLQLSGGDVYQENILWFSWLAGVILGSMIGSNQVLESQAKAGARNVVITGSTRGLGKALAREFLRAGDSVVIASRSRESVRSAMTELEEELQKRDGFFQFVEQENGHSWFIKAEKGKFKLIGTNCDVSNSTQVQALGALAVQELGSIDIWINNAGVNKGFRPFFEFSNQEIEQIISTNLIGSIICTREAIRIMKLQPKKGHIFNMDGAGSDGASTPLTAVYGASKSGLRQFHASLLKECKRSRVGIHTASPGMVLTDLLLSGSSLQNKKIFNLICEQPETVARALVPKMRAIKETGKAINYLTPPRLILAIITAWLRRGRWFDEEGKAVYAAEADRLRMWAEERQRSHITATMEMVPSSAWVSLFSSSVICAYIILSSASSSNMPGT